MNGQKRDSIYKHTYMLYNTYINNDFDLKITYKRDVKYENQ